MPRHAWYRAGLAYRDNPERVHVGGVSVSYAIGYSGFSAGPNHHYIDELGLSDPLIARLPLPRGGEFRPGHFFRTAPDGYRESIEQDQNLIVDPDLKQYYEAIRIITRGPLLSGERIATIFRFASGRYDRYLDAFARKHRLRARRARARH
jgi:arabinofuranosyltransferase